MTTRIQFNLRFALLAVALLAILLAYFVEHEQVLESTTIKTDDGNYFLKVTTAKHSTFFTSRLTVNAHIGLSSGERYLCGYYSRIGAPYTDSETPVSLRDDSDHLPHWIRHPDLPSAIYARYWLTEDAMMEIGVLPTKGGHTALGGRVPTG